MSVALNIRDQVKRKVQSCPSVQQTYGYEEVNPTGWPCVMITLQGINGEYSSNTENSRVYAYRALALFPIGQDIEQPKTLNRLEYAEDTLTTVIDEIINAIDDNFELEGSPTLFVEASDVTWGYMAAEFGEARSAEITISVYTEITI